MDGIFDTISGLPLHPLVVHLAVVGLPVAALGVLAILVVPRWRRTFGWLTMAALGGGTVASFVAKESGEALAKRVGLPVDHAAWGDRLPPVAFLLFVVTAIWFMLARNADSASAAGKGRGKAPVAAAPATRNTLELLTRIAAGVLALVTLGVTVLVGHSGATAVWSGKINASSTSTTVPTPAPTSNAAATTKSGSAATSAAAPAAGTYTWAMVQAHNSASSCWTVINGSVYDLTNWISQHPGGPGVITALCGGDGTAAFDGQHSGQRRPASELAGFKLGPLS